MVYNMPIQKERDTRPFKPQIHQKRKRGQNWQNCGDRDRNRSFNRYRVSHRQNFKPNHRRPSQDRHIQNGHDNRRGSYRYQNYGTRGDNRDQGRDRVNYRRNFSNDWNSSRDRNRSRTRERTIRTLDFSLWQNIPVVRRQASMLYWALHQVWEQPSNTALYVLLS